ncbi:hypothetical protein RDI58_025630 [Solanum bulbocastanum]|uniref:HTH myb-type domain-containing protein n=1 Tax=Solanum bulbocastanum TaxID=147425 RepID=A0AAN8T4J0_SOLBU
MSIQGFISTQENEYFSSDYSLGVSKNSAQDLVDQDLQYSSYMETCLPVVSSSSSSIINCIGSPSSAFFATERCLGLTQYDNQYDTSELIKNCDLQMSSYDPQQCKNGILEDSLAKGEADFRHEISLPSFIRTEFSTSPFSDVSEAEKESLLHLKNELLGEFDSSYRRHPSLPSDGNQDYCQSASPPLAFHNSASSGVSHKPSKTRIRWNEALHDRFLECVNRLGGADKATPKQILNLMDSDSLTLDHVKSHLQKYRNAKHPESAGKSEKRNSSDAMTDIESKTGREIKEALKMQLEVQRCLHEQLETQRTLQMRIEEQAKKLKMILDQQQKTNRTLLETRNSNLSSPGVEILVVEDSDN